ncbi:MAG: M18 family aminopeptidase [Clostridiales bacterium]|nr:M18 family aminopeptidase [Clostridiales bacterium]
MNLGRELISFIQKSPTGFHAVDTVRKELEEAGYLPLMESECWNLEEGGCYYVMRNHSSLLAFQIPHGEFTGFQIGAAHSDSPSFRIKPEMELETLGEYIRINAEPYGGGIYSSWLDRPLSVAGRVMVETEKGAETRLVQVDQDWFVIPQLAIHMNRKINEGHSYAANRDMVPLFSGIKGKGSFRKQIARECGTKPEHILGMDLFLYNRTPGMLWGDKEEFVSAPRLDDLQCAFCLLKGFLGGTPSEAIPVYALFDNEEVGSLSKQGADSDFLSRILHRICYALGKTEEEILRLFAGSFLVSADNAHAVHPNFPEYSDPVNRVYMNQGVVLKFNGNQKYTSDGVSEALFRQLCRRTGTACQSYTNRSDMPGGSTLGNLSNRHISLLSADIGLAQLAMHSCYETAGTKDLEDMIRVMKEFFSTALKEVGSGCYSW